MEDELKTNLRAVFDAFAASSDLAASTIWARAAKDARFLDRIESGKGFTVGTYDRALVWFASHWPDGAVWPASVAKPDAAPVHKEGCAA